MEIPGIVMKVMGGGISSLPRQLDFDTVRHFAGDLFDAEVFNALRDEEGMVDRDQVEALIPVSASEGAYTSMNPLNKISAKGDIALVDGPWLVNLYLNGGILPCRQELPEEGFVHSQDLDDESIQIVAISWPWLSVQHPDPNGFHLSRIATILDVFMRFENMRVAVFLDFCSCFQEYYAPTGYKLKPQNDYPVDCKIMKRNFAQASFFRQALVNINLWFGNTRTLVLVQSALPDLLGRGDDAGKVVKDLRICMPLSDLNLARHGERALHAHLEDPKLGIGVRLTNGGTFIEDVEIGSRGEIVFGLTPGLRVVAVGHGERGVPQHAETIKAITEILTRLRLVQARSYVVVFEQRPYDSRAWCQFERRLAEMITPVNRLLDLGHVWHTMRETQCDNVYDFISKYNIPTKLVFETTQVLTKDKKGVEQMEVKKNTKNIGGYGGFKLPETWDEFLTMESHMKGSGNKVVDLLSGRKQAPQSPNDFTDHLKTLTIAYPEDRPLLSKRYKEAFDAVFNNKWSDALNFSGVGWRFKFQDLWGISFVKNADRITSLDLSNNPELEGTFAIFQALPEICLLNLNGCKNFDCSNAFELICSKEWKMKAFLTDLHLDGTNVQSYLGPAIDQSGIRHLKQLTLNNCWQLKHDLQEWELAPQKNTVTKLSLSGCREIIGNLSSLRNMSALLVLHLDWCNKIKGNLEDIGHIQTLKELDLTYLERLEGTLEPLRYLKRLESLDLRACEMLEGNLEPLGELLTLTNLNLQGCDKLKGTLEPLQRLTQLKTLNLCFCHGLYGDLKPLSNLLELNRIDLAGEPLRQSRLAGDFTPLRGLTQLVHLNVSNCSSLAGFNLFRHEHAEFLAETRSQVHPKFQLLDIVMRNNATEVTRKAAHEAAREAKIKAEAEREAAEAKSGRSNPYAKNERPGSPKDEEPVHTTCNTITYEFSRPDEYDWGSGAIRFGRRRNKYDNEDNDT